LPGNKNEIDDNFLVDFICAYNSGNYIKFFNFYENAFCSFKLIFLTRIDDFRANIIKKVYKSYYSLSIDYLLKILFIFDRKVLFKIIKNVLNFEINELNNFINFKEIKKGK